VRLFRAAVLPSPERSERCAPLCAGFALLARVRPVALRASLQLTCHLGRLRGEHPRACPEGGGVPRSALEEVEGVAPGRSYFHVVTISTASRADLAAFAARHRPNFESWLAELV